MNLVKVLWPIPLAMVLFVSPSNASYGTSDGGGGVGVRCSGEGGPLFELLDIHEIKRAGESISLAPANKEEAIELAAYKLGTHYYPPSEVSSRPYIGYLKRNIVAKIFRGEGFSNPMNGQTVKVEFVRSLPLSDDIGEYDIGPNCELEQVAYYFDQINTLKIVVNKWSELSWLDKSALVSHEIHYFMDRFNGIEDFGSTEPKSSERAREFVGRLYSNKGVTPKYSISPRTDFILCETNVDVPRRPTSFRLFNRGVEAVALFMHVQSYGSVYQTTSVFREFRAQDLESWQAGNISSETALHIDTPENIPEFRVRIEKQQYQSPTLQAFMIDDGAVTPMGDKEQLVCSDQSFLGGL